MSVIKTTQYKCDICRLYVSIGGHRDTVGVAIRFDANAAERAVPGARRVAIVPANNPLFDDPETLHLCKLCWRSLVELCQRGGGARAQATITPPVGTRVDAPGNVIVKTANEQVRIAEPMT